MASPASHSLPAVPAAMYSATDFARASIQQFLDAFAAPLPTQSGFCLLVRLPTQPDDDHTPDHLWLGDLDLSTNPASGVPIASESAPPESNQRQRVSFGPDEVSDWMYTEAGQLVGSFSTRMAHSESPQPTSRFSLLRELWLL